LLDPWRGRCSRCGLWSPAGAARGVYIDGIGSVTLSVRAMRKVARLALLLHGEAIAAGVADDC